MSKDSDRIYNRFTEEQRELFSSIQKYIFTFCHAKAGTGKTLIAVSALLDLLEQGKINKIVYIQKVTQRFLQNGFLPGTIEEKTRDLWTPFYDAMETLGYQPEAVDKMVENGEVFLITDSAMRGINLEKAGIVLDECQSMDFHTLKLIYTRVKDNCHVIAIGDVKQKDNKGKNSDFIKYNTYLASKNFGNELSLTHNFRGLFSKTAEDYEE